MEKRFSAKLLYRIRNKVPLASLLKETLQYPCKKIEGYDRFLCPKCCDFNTAINPKNNLGRCFRCEENFNGIDLVMLLEGMKFVEAVYFLEKLLPEKTSI